MSPPLQILRGACPLRPPVIAAPDYRWLTTAQNPFQEMDFQFHLISGNFRYTLYIREIGFANMEKLYDIFDSLHCKHYTGFMYVPVPYTVQSTLFSSRLVQRYWIYSTWTVIVKFTTHAGGRRMNCGLAIYEWIMPLLFINVFDYIYFSSCLQILGGGTFDMMSPPTINIGGDMSPCPPVPPVIAAHGRGWQHSKNYTTIRDNNLRIEKTKH